MKTDAPCVHRWVLGSPGQNGAATGKCRLCGIDRAFTGGLPDGTDPNHWRSYPAPEPIPAVLRGELL